MPDARALPLFTLIAATLGEAGPRVPDSPGALLLVAALIVAAARQAPRGPLHLAVHGGLAAAAGLGGATVARLVGGLPVLADAGASALLAAGLLLGLAAWRLGRGRGALDSVHGPGATAFFWVLLALAQGLGTALGAWTASSAGLDPAEGTVIFVALLVVVLAARLFTRWSATLIFIGTFVLTRPLGEGLTGTLSQGCGTPGFLAGPVSPAVSAAGLLALALLLARARRARRSR